MRQGTRRLMGDETGWSGYLKAISLGARLPSAQARLLLRLDIAGNTPGDCRKRIEHALQVGRIDNSGYMERIEALEALMDMYDRGVQTHQVPIERGQWIPVSPGGYQRRNLGGDY